VIFKCGGKKLKSTIKQKTLEPVWNEEFGFPVCDPMDSLEVIVEDDDTLKNDFLGKVILPLINYSDMRTERKWLKLFNDDGLDDGENRGSVMLQVQWRFNPALLLQERKGTGWGGLRRCKR
jgi:Ca2+-dependent lipid-binding protein